LTGYENCAIFEDALDRYLYNEDYVNFNELQKFAAKMRKTFPSLSPAKGGDASLLSELWKTHLRARAVDEEMRREAHERMRRATETVVPKSPEQPSASTEEEDDEEDVEHPDVGEGQPSRQRLGAVMRLKMIMRSLAE
jgi:hypothetical protein